MLVSKFWPIFRCLKSHNFLTAACKSTKLCTVIAKSTYKIRCKGFKDWCNSYEFITVCVTLCKIREHGGFSLRQSQILRIFKFEFVTFKQTDILRANIFIKHRKARIDRYTLIEQPRLCTLKLCNRL